MPDYENGRGMNHCFFDSSTVSERFIKSEGDSEESNERDKQGAGEELSVYVFVFPEQP
jgi:hypothetical protein